MRSMTKKVWITFIIGIIAGVIGTHYWLVSDGKKEADKSYIKGDIGLLDMIKDAH